jgi:hypothetical protein
MMMKLSEAIRLGAMMKPQAFGPQIGSSTTKDKSCALQAASEALSLTWTHATAAYSELFNLYPFLRQSAICPMTGLIHDDTMQTIYLLNDVHKWTREAIADWVETIEEKEAVAVAPVTSAPPVFVTV